jgi:hypothetical protein
MFSEGFFFVCGATAHLWPRPSHCSGFCITQIHTAGWTTLTEWSARRRGRYLYNTQQTQEMNIHSLREIQTQDTRNQTAADLRLTTHGHQERLSAEYTLYKRRGTGASLSKAHSYVPNIRNLSVGFEIPDMT